MISVLIYDVKQHFFLNPTPLSLRRNSAPTPTLTIQIHFQNLIYTVKFCAVPTFAWYISTLEFDWESNSVKTKKSTYIRILTFSFHFNLFYQVPEGVF